MKVRGKGLIFAVELVSEKVGDEIYNELLEQGFIVCNRKALFRIDPPLITTEKEFNKFISTFKSIINAKKKFT